MASRADRRRATKQGRKLTTPAPLIRPAPSLPPVNAVISIPAWRSMEMKLVEMLILIEQRSCTTGPIYEFLLKWNDSLITRARSKIASSFLTDRPNSDILVMIDTDMTFNLPALDALVGLAREKKGIAAAPVAIRSAATWANVRCLPDTPIDFGPDTEPQEVRYIGAAFMAIHRSVFEKLREGLENVGFDDPWWKFFIEVDVDYKGRGPEGLSEDYTFCHLAREAGFGVWCLTNHQVGHMGLYEFKISPTKGYDFD